MQVARFAPRVTRVVLTTVGLIAVLGSRPEPRDPAHAPASPFAARTLMALRRWLPDRAFDGFLRTQFPSPAA